MSIPFQLSVGEGLTLRGDVHLPEQRGERAEGMLPVLLFCHGFKGFKDWGSFPYASKKLADLGLAVISFNFSCNGVGESLTEFDELEKFGINTYAREVEDLHQLVNALLEGRLPGTEYMDSSKIFIMGHSKGGGDAILFGASNPLVKGIISWNGIAHVDLFPPDLRKEIEETGIGYIPNARTGQNMPITKAVIDDVDTNANEYDLMQKVGSMNQAYLIVQGDKDFARMVAGAKKLKEACPHAQIHWIEDGDHTWNTKHPFAGSSPALEEAIRVTAQFVKDTVATVGTPT